MGRAKNGAQAVNAAGFDRVLGATRGRSAHHHEDASYDAGILWTAQLPAKDDDVLLTQLLAKLHAGSPYPLEVLRVGAHQFDYTAGWESSWPQVSVLLAAVRDWYVQPELDRATKLVDQFNKDFHLTASTTKLTEKLTRHTRNIVYGALLQKLDYNPEQVTDDFLRESSLGARSALQGLLVDRALNEGPTVYNTVKQRKPAFKNGFERWELNGAIEDWLEQHDAGAGPEEAYAAFCRKIL